MLDITQCPGLFDVAGVESLPIEVRSKRTKRQRYALILLMQQQQQQQQNHVRSPLLIKSEVVEMDADGASDSDHPHNDPSPTSSRSDDRSVVRVLGTSSHAKKRSSHDLDSPLFVDDESPSMLEILDNNASDHPEHCECGQFTEAIAPVRTLPASSYNYNYHCIHNTSN